MKIHDLFEKHEKEFLRFEQIENKLSTRPDLHAFILLNNLFPGNRDIVSAASHNQFWLNVDEEDIEQLTEKQIIELLRCGISHDSEFGNLYSFT